MGGPTFKEFLEKLRLEPDPEPPPRYGGYSGYRQIFERLERLRQGGARIEAIGRSTGGEPMWAVHLGAEEPRRRVLYFANLHAQEFIGVEAALATLERAAERIGAGDPRWQGVAVTGVPTCHPDGYREVVRDLAAGRPRFRRKNRRGVDLNRNFAEGFAPRAPLGRLLPRIYFPGAEPLSEAETRALDGLFARRYHRALSFHSFGRWIFWPWAHRGEPSPDEPRFRALAEAMRGRQSAPYRAVQLGRWARWFKAGGAEIDHLYGRYGTLAFLMEVSGGGGSLGRPSTWLDAFAWFNPRALAQSADEAAEAALALCEAADDQRIGL